MVYFWRILFEHGLYLAKKGKIHFEFKPIT